MEHIKKRHKASKHVRQSRHTNIIIGLVLIVAALNIAFIALALRQSAPHVSFPLKRTMYVIPKIMHVNTPQIIKLPIVMYHYIEYVQNKNDTLRMKLDTNPDVLDGQLKSLHDTGYHTFFVSDAADFVKKRLTVPHKSIVLTFDDGYEDFYINAYPILKKYNMKATIYIISNYIGRSGFLTKEEIEEMLQSGLIEVGAHTLNHPDLKSIPLEEVRHEVFDSKKNLEEMFGVAVKTFAYPGGAYNDEVVKLVKEASYEAALSTNPGIYYSEDHLYVLPRIRPGYMIFDYIATFFEGFHL